MVKECAKENINIFPLPGPSSVTSAVSISGFSEKYLFYGFFPEKEKTLKEDFEILSNLDTSIVFFISPKKINKIIPSIKTNFSGRNILICREMSKFYEEYIRCKVDELKIFDKDPKGEITIVISEKEHIKKTDSFLRESDKRNISKMIDKLSIQEITDLISQHNKVSKKIIYNYCLKLKSSFTFISFLTDLTPCISQAIFVSLSFSSGSSTFPVKNILPSKTFEFTENKYFLSKISTLAVRFFCIIESSICVPTDLGSNAILTPVPKIPFEETPTQLDKKKLKNNMIKNLFFIF